MSLNTGEIEAPAFDLERLLREQKALLDSACVGIAFVKNRTIVRCNPHFAKIFGFTSHDEVVGVRSAQLHPSLAVLSQKAEYTVAFHEQLTKLSDACAAATATFSGAA